MAENSKKTSATNLGCDLLKKINDSDCGIKYPNNILSCLKTFNFYDHSKICPHYCPAGKIIKICSTPSGISSIWVSITTQVLPLTGEALYILKRSSTILKNEFPLIGFMGKSFSILDIAMFKIDDLCILQIAQELKIGVKIYFKHWEECFVPLLEIPREGIEIPRPTGNEKNQNDSEDQNGTLGSDFLHSMKKISSEISGTQMGSQKFHGLLVEDFNRPNENLKKTGIPIAITRKSKESSCGSHLGLGSTSENCGSSADSTLGIWGSTLDEIHSLNKNSYENMGFFMDSPTEFGNCEEFFSGYRQAPENFYYNIENERGSQSTLDENIKNVPEMGTKMGAKLEIKMGARKIHLGCEISSKVEPKSGSKSGTHLESQINYCQEGSHLGSAIKSQIISKVRTYLDSQVESKLDFREGTQMGSPVYFQNFGDKTGSEAPAYENVFLSKIHSPVNGTHLGSRTEFPDWPLNNNETSRSTISEMEVRFNENCPPCDKLNGNPQKGSEVYNNFFTFLFNHSDFLVVILVCLLLFLFFYILTNYK